ncbi:MAG TPA: hypothetical protein VLM39_03185 [Ignavibacteriaceae bacterium]|nr:hypothetical protein [Ignavibacteriaceae bacterium]
MIAWMHECMNVWVHGRYGLMQEIDAGCRILDSGYWILDTGCGR